MAHVLLPCDLPTWNDIQRHLAQLKLAKDSKELVQGMEKIHEICNISLEPEDLHRNKKQEYNPIFDKFETFLEETLSEDDRKVFFDEILPNLVTQALHLKMYKSPKGFLYSLRNEDEKFEMDRNFAMALLANCFFSTFPRRTPKTHPSLQNFTFSEFFQHLYRRSQQKKLKAFLRYFERIEEKKNSSINFQRKIINNSELPSLPGWLCSDRALIPLIIRHEGNIHDAEPNIWRAFPCCSLVGGNVLQSASSLESSLFFAFPELLCCLSFIEKLDDNEALVVHNVMPYGIRKKRRSSASKVTICLMDGMVDFGSDCDKQFEDSSLLRELNKAYVAFNQKDNAENNSEEFIEEPQRRQTPVGESSSSGQPSACSSRRPSTHKEEQVMMNEQRKKSYLQEEEESHYMKAKRNPADYEKVDRSSVIHNSEDTSNLTRLSKNEENTSKPQASGIPLLPHLRSLKMNASSSKSSTRSLKTASESSLEAPKQLSATKYGADDEYYTADEDSDKDNSEYGIKIRSNKTHSPNLSSLLKSTYPLVEEASKLENCPGKLRNTVSSNKNSSSLESDLSHCESSSRRSGSLGFVLGGTVSDEDLDDFAIEEDDKARNSHWQLHERLEDFHKRIRRRTRRHLSRKIRSNSRSSYSLGSSTSSDMEDISEEDDSYHHNGVIRTSNSEPSLCTAVNKQNSVVLSPFGGGLSPAADTVLVSVGGHKVLITTSNGQLKAYSYDGVNPNLPVPFRARFRTRHHRYESSNDSKDSKDLRDDRFWLPGYHEVGYGLNLSASTYNSEEDKISSSRQLSNVSSHPSMESNEQLSSFGENLENRKKPSKLNAYSIAVGPSKCGDPQLRALVLWLAASMAGLPSLIFYTGQEPLLQELNSVQRKVLSRKWTVGDLSCEILRFCRNKLSPRRQSCATSLFEQFFSSGSISIASSASYSQQSLD